MLGHHLGRVLNGVAGLMGLRIADFRGAREVAHWGSTGGYRAWLARYPAQHLSVAMLCNASDAEPVQTGRLVAESYISDLAAPKPAPPMGNPPPGYYVDAESGRPVLIKSEPDGRSSANGIPLLAVSANHWTAIGADTGSEIDFVFERDGSLTLKALGETIHYRRAAPAKPTDFAAYLGRYCAIDNPLCLNVTVTAAGDLAVGTTGRPAQRPLSLRPVTSDLFESASHTFLRFQWGDGAKVESFTLGDGRTSGLVFRRVWAPQSQANQSRADLQEDRQSARLPAAPRASQAGEFGPMTRH